METKGAVLLVLLFAWPGSGCCRARRTYPRPGAGRLLAAVRGRNARLRTLRAKLTADQLTSRGRVKLTVFLLAARGGKLRMEATVLDNTVAVFVSDGARFQSLDLKKHVAYTGRARPCNVARLFGLPLEPDQVVVVLLGGVPILRHDGIRVTWDPCHGRERLVLSDERTGLVQEIWLRRRGNGWRVEGTRIRNEKGTTLLTVAYRRFVRRGGVELPQWVRYLQKHPRTDLLLRFKKVEVDVEIPEDAYRLSVPEGWPLRILECRDEDQVAFEPVGNPAVPAKEADTP